MERVLDAKLHHLRSGAEREWTEFPPEAEGSELKLGFEIQTPRPSTLRLRHRDIKQRWIIEVNGQRVGTLPVDENQMVTFWDLPQSMLVQGQNELRISGSGRASDDVLLGDVRLIERPRAEVLSDGTIEVRVVDADTGQPTPARITVLDDTGVLMSTAAESSHTLAVRPGIVFSSTGAAHLPVAAGKYRIVAGRGFEYSIDQAALELQPGDVRQVSLTIRREVPTQGYAACDPHSHTFTHSRHGDATIEERMITLAAEGVELSVAADHNIQIDYEPSAKALGVRQYFTPIVGNEVTTDVGHFIVFPLLPGPASMDHRGQDWASVFGEIFAGDERRLVVLNHARDIHKGFRPFDPRHHIGIAGERLDGQTLKANLMEVVNSGTTQTDGLQLFHDWFGLLNRGVRITPVAASDSHDVGRHFIGQGRTYIRCDDAHPGKIDREQVYDSLRAGRVNVSYGLLADLTVNGQYGPGDLVPAGEQLTVATQVLGPHWTQAQGVTLYANGVAIRQASLDDEKKPGNRGVIWQGKWKLQRPRHDIFLAVIATGPGVRDLYWPTPKPYQPTSADFTPYTLGASGAVWIDGDGDGRFTSAYEYAQQAVTNSGNDLPLLIRALEPYDEAVAIQAASILRAQGISPRADKLQQALEAASADVQRGFSRYDAAWRASQRAMVEAN